MWSLYVDKSPLLGYYQGGRAWNFGWSTFMFLSHVTSCSLWSFSLKGLSVFSGVRFLSDLSSDVHKVDLILMLLGDFRISDRITFFYTLITLFNHCGFYIVTHSTLISGISCFNTNPATVIKFLSSLSLHSHPDRHKPACLEA